MHIMKLQQRDGQYGSVNAVINVVSSTANLMGAKPTHTNLGAL